MLGIDISRYQNVTDWNAVKRHGVRFVWVKGTDGGGPAPVQRADAQVAGARSVGTPVGIYHYAQLLPAPEAQADVLAAEVRRLEARYGPLLVPPALDLEDPHVPGSAAATFARRFLARLKAHGFGRVTLYANTSMLTGIRADDIRRDIPGVVIWAARYGDNDGRNNGLGGYRGWVDVHQYTSVGQVSGIQASGVDLNEAANLNWMNGDVMDWKDRANGFFWDGYPARPDFEFGTMLAESYNHAKTAQDAALRTEAKLAALTGTLSDNQAALLAAISDDETQITLSPEQMELLLNGVEDASARGLYEALRARFDPPTES